MYNATSRVKLISDTADTGKLTDEEEEVLLAGQDIESQETKQQSKKSSSKLFQD